MPKPKRIILFIGDGMGVAALTAGHYAKGHDKPLEMMQMPHATVMRTHEHEFVTTDSAASATAFATGDKTHYEGVSVKPGTTQAQEEDKAFHLETMVAAAKRAGLRTGLVATSRIVHATPAAFASHRAYRGSYEAIAKDMSLSGVDVMLGAGSKYFTKRKDGQDLLAKMKKQGYSVALDPKTLDEHLDKGATKLVGLLHEKDMPSMLKGGRVRSLAQLTKDAIKALDHENPEGFFLMVEGSQIDWEEHAMNGEGTIREVLDLDAAVGVAREYAKQRDDTLIVVTADHETGGLSVFDDQVAAPYVELFSSQDEMNRRIMANKALTDAGVVYPPAMMTHELGSPIRGQRMVTTFGYLSMASRGLWQNPKSRFIATHTATMVPLLAQGVGAEFVLGVHDNADLGRVLKGAILSGKEELDPKVKSLMTQKQLHYTQGVKPKNVIVLIGDGMGVSTVTAGYYALGKLNMLNMPRGGFVSTHGVDRLTNDSAATATALATGSRTHYGAVGMTPSKEGVLVPSMSVLEQAEGRGLHTGLVTTTTITHATPAAFYGHVPNRKDEVGIAAQFIDFPNRIPGSDGIDIAIGGGQSYFSPELRALLKAQGVQVVEQLEKLDPKASRGLVLLDKFAPESAEARQKKGGPSLAQMTRVALERLDHKEEGFFLMVEGGQIDWALHAMDRSDTLIQEIKDFDGAVGVALQHARRSGDTLVLVTADHDHTMSVLDNHYGFVKGQCGIAKLCGGEEEMPVIPIAKGLERGEGLVAGANGVEPGMILQYAWPAQSAMRETGQPRPGPHAAHFVPLFAEGPGQEWFSGFMGQDQVGRVLQAWAKGQ